MDLRCGFGMMYGAGSSNWSSLFWNYLLLLVVRMRGWQIICNSRMETFIGIFSL
jgi:hypothetical protein